MMSLTLADNMRHLRYVKKSKSRGARAIFLPEQHSAVFGANGQQSPVGQHPPFEGQHPGIELAEGVSAREGSFPYHRGIIHIHLGR
jgi:hypothetical protein